MTFSLGEDLLVRLVGGPGEREHLPVDVDGGEVGDVDVSVNKIAKEGNSDNLLKRETLQGCPLKVTPFPPRHY